MTQKLRLRGLSNTKIRQRIDLSKIYKVSSNKSYVRNNMCLILIYLHYAKSIYYYFTFWYASDTLLGFATPHRYLRIRYKTLIFNLEYLIERLFIKYLKIHLNSLIPVEVCNVYTYCKYMYYLLYIYIYSCHIVSDIYSFHE